MRDVGLHFWPAVQRGPLTKWSDAKRNCRTSISMFSLSMIHAQSHFCTDPSLENIFLFHWPSLWVSGAGPLAPCVSAGYQSQASFRKMAMSHLDLFIIPIIDLRGSPNGTYKAQGAGTPLRLEVCHEGNGPSAPLVLVCCPATASLVYCPASLCAKTLSSKPQAKRRDVSQVLKGCIGWLRLQSGSFKRDTLPRGY